MRNMKLFFMLLAAMSMFFLAACGGDADDTTEENEDVETEETESEGQEAVDKSDTVTHDEDLVAEIEEEEGVISASLIITEDGGQMALLDFEVADDIDEPQAEELANDLANRLQEAYPEHTIDAQARKDGATIAQVTLELEE